MGNKGSISVDLPALKTQAESAKSASKTASEAIAHYEKASQSLAGSQLKGQTYDAAKQYCSGPFKTLLTGTKNFYEEASAACDKLVSQYESMVDTKSWDSEELNRLIQSANQAIQNHQTAMKKIQKKKTLTPHLIDAKNKHLISIAGQQALKQKYEKILKGLEQFSQQSASWFGHLTDVSKSLNSGLSSLSSGVNAENGTMTLPPSGDWEKEVKTFNTDHENTKSMNEEEKAYYYTLQDTYGFDPQTAKSIIKVKQGIDKKFPNLSQREKDYLFTRLIGGITYESTSTSKAAWNNVSGNFIHDYLYMIKGVSDINDVLKFLGLSQKNADKLEYKVNKQHLNAKNYPDFSHQMITTAAILYDNPLPNDFRFPDLIYSHEGTNDFAGWKGDTTKTIFGYPSIKNDDYKADLDAMNISSQMNKKHKSFIETSNNYYKNIQNNTLNRAEEFKKNQSLKEVKDAIDESKERVKDKEHLSDKQVNELFDDSFNFIYSLEKNSNEYINK